MSTPPNRRRRLQLGIAAAVIVIVLLEGLSYAALAAAPRVLTEPPLRRSRIMAEQTQRVNSLLTPNPLRREALDPELGWRYRKGFVRDGDVINSQGLRSLREYAPVPPAGVTRVAAFGDSFVYGNEVDTKDAWSTKLEAIAPTVEVLNYGVGGYGVDQSYLRFKAEGTALSPSVVAMGFVSDDLRRLVNVYRRFVSLYEPPLAKPRFVLRGEDSLELIATPLRDTSDYLALQSQPDRIVQLGANDQWYSPAIYENPLYDVSATVRLGVTAWRLAHARFFDAERLLDGDEFNVSSEAFKLQVALFQRFARDAEQSGVRPLVLIFPDRESLLALREGRRAPFAPLTDELRRRQIDYLDLTAAFPRNASADTFEGWFMPGGHLSVSGNELVAQAVATALRERVPTITAEGATPSR